MANGNQFSLPPGFEIEGGSGGLPPGFEIEVAGGEDAPIEASQPSGASPRSRRSTRARQKRETEMEEFLSSLTPERRELLESINPFEAAAIGAGKGLTTIGRGLGLADPETEGERESFAQLKRVSPVATTTGEILAEAAPFIAPALGAARIASLPARIAATSGIGAAEGGIISRGKGGGAEETAKGAALGGAIAGGIELVLPIISRIGGKLFRKVTGENPTSNIIDDAGVPTPEFQSALDDLGLTIDDVAEEAASQVGRVDPSQAARKSFLESQGFKPTKAQITRDAGDFQAQQEAAKTSSRVRSALEDQEQVLSTRFDSVVRGSGGDINTPTNTIVDSLTDKATVLDSKISDLYKLAREAAPGEKNVRFNKLASKLKELAPANRRSGGNIEAVVGDLKAKGVIDDNLRVVGRIDVETAEDTRKLMNELFDAQNVFGNAKLRELKDALDEDVFGAAGGDVFGQARKAKADFEKELTRAKISKFDSRKSNLVRDILENKIDPDQLTKKVIFSQNWRPEDLQQLKDYITTSDTGKKAFNDLRADVIQSIKDKSFIGAEDAKGFQTLSRDKLEKAINSIGKGKLEVLFTTGERRFLDDMLKVTKLREPVRGTALGRGPSAQAIGRLEEAVNKIPIVGALIEGARLDRQGRLIVKASPQLKDITPISPPRQAAAQIGAIGAVSASQEQE